MVKSEKLYSAQSYLEAVTGECYISYGDNDIEFIRKYLCEDVDDDLLDFSLSEIDRIVKNALDVVLVDCLVYNETTNEFEHQYRWFEVPEDFEEEV